MTWRIKRTFHLCNSNLYSTLQIEVVASDNRNPEKTDTSEVIIIVDTDRFNPVFVPNQPSIIFNTNERTPVGTVLGTLSADDNDLRGSIVYEATGEYPGLNFFGVNATTGQVYIMNNLMNDIQATTTYTVSVKNCQQCRIIWYIWETHCTELCFGNIQILSL